MSETTSDVIGAEDSNETHDRSMGSWKFRRRRADDAPSEHASRMTRLYRGQAGIFDLTRAPILLGRSQLSRFLAPGAAVLEVGCGTGRNLPALRAAVGPSGRVIGVECAPAMAARARRRAGAGIAVVQGEYGAGRELPGVAAMDAVVFSYSLSMIPHFDRVLQQARRDLKPGGRLIVLDFADSKWRWMRAWMRSFGVELGDARPKLLTETFEPVVFHRSTNWGGLWETYLLIATRR